MTKTINKEDLKRISFEHLNFCLNNVNLFLDKNTFSIIQYSNISSLKSNYLLGIQIYNQIAKTPRNNTYLNFGMGPGFLEYNVKNYGKINLESVEWEQQKEQFSTLRKSIDVDNQVTYVCNNIKSNEFEIFNCTKTYDFIILTRFYPLNSYCSPDINSVKTILNKLKKYSNKFIIFDNKTNYNDEIINFFEDIKYNKLELNTNSLHSWTIEL